MSLKDIVSKYGYTGSTKDWFSMKNPSLEDVRKAVARGKLEEIGFSIPFELRRYLDISSEGKLIEIQAVPDELQRLADEVKRRYNELGGCEYGQDKRKADREVSGFSEQYSL